MPWTSSIQLGLYGNKFINTSQSIHRMISGSSEFGALHNSKWDILVNATQKVLTGRDVQTKMVSHVLNIGSTAFQKNACQYVLALKPFRN